MATLKVKESYEGKDAFPSKISTTVEKLAYPEKNFKCWASNKDVKIITLFMNEERKIYFTKRDMEEKYFKNLSENGKECQSYDRFYPDSLEWGKIAARFKRPPKQIQRKNADVRMSYKLNNKFLVKAFFTFGLKRVEPGTVHLIQTSAVPILFYVLRKGDSRKSLPFEDKIFYFDKIHMFDRSILLENGAHRIPEGTMYMLFTLQKTFFSVDILKNDFEIPFRVTDPVANKVTALKRSLDVDVPPKTPFVDDDNDDEDEEDEDDEQPRPSTSAYLPPAKRRKTEEERDFEEFMIMNPTDPCTSASSVGFPDASPGAASREEERQQQQQQQQQQQKIDSPTQDITLWVLPNPPILERKAVEVAVDFAKNYQILNSQTKGDPRDAVLTEGFPDTEVLDLSKNGNRWPAGPTCQEIVNLENHAYQSLENTEENPNAGQNSGAFINFEETNAGLIYPGAAAAASEELPDLGTSGMDLEEILGPIDPSIEYEIGNLIAQFNCPPVANEF